jgi:hypothetical protein
VILRNNARVQHIGAHGYHVATVQGHGLGVRASSQLWRRSGLVLGLSVCRAGSGQCGLRVGNGGCHDVQLKGSCLRRDDQSEKTGGERDIRIRADVGIDDTLDQWGIVCRGGGWWGGPSGDLWPVLSPTESKWTDDGIPAEKQRHQAHLENSISRFELPVSTLCRPEPNAVAVHGYCTTYSHEAMNKDSLFHLSFFDTE